MGVGIQVILTVIPVHVLYISAQGPATTGSLLICLKNNGSLAGNALLLVTGAITGAVTPCQAAVACLEFAVRLL
jgi:hypothetical protein